MTVGNEVVVTVVSVGFGWLGAAQQQRLAGKPRSCFATPAALAKQAGFAGARSWPRRPALGSGATVTLTRERTAAYGR